MSWAALFLVGCASASVDVPSNNTDAPGPTPDGPVGDPDGPSPDSAPVMVTLTQTTSPTIAVGNTVNCNDGVSTVENSYYRVFPLAAAGITGPFQLQSVSFGVESATSAAGNTQTATIRVGTYGGTIAANTTSLDLLQMQELTTAAATIPNGSSTVTTPISATVPANSNLFVEILSPDAGNVFFPGSNNGGESLPGFIRAPDCSTPNPANYSTAVGAAVHVLISVTGTH